MEEMEEKMVDNEEALNRRKTENQELRRKLTDFDNLQYENANLIEVLQKKNNDLIELKELVFQKEQHTGEYDMLAKEN